MHNILLNLFIYRSFETEEPEAHRHAVLSLWRGRQLRIDHAFEQFNQTEDIKFSFIVKDYGDITDKLTRQ